MKRNLVMVALLGTLAFLMIGGKPLDGMTLVYEQLNPNPGPGGCYHEDSYHYRAYTGSLAPGAAFTVNLPFCNNYPVGPGNCGIFLSLGGKGELVMWLVSPTGITHEATWVYHAKGKNVWRQCEVPPYIQFPEGMPQGIFIGEIEPGTWTLHIQNQSGQTVRDIDLMVLAATSEWSRQSMCPENDKSVVVP